MKSTDGESAMADSKISLILSSDSPDVPPINSGPDALSMEWNSNDSIIFNKKVNYFVERQVEFSSYSHCKGGLTTARRAVQ